MKIGRTIRIYLDDGSTSGIRHAEIVNWTGQAMSVPRTKIKSLSEWEESKKPGVYFLFGVDDETGKQATYIGEAENVFERLQYHIANKEFWNEVIIFTNKDENLTKSHVKYLESRLIQLATEAGRYTLFNSNAPQKNSLPRGDRDAMEEFILNLRVLLGMFGHKVLETLIHRTKAASSNHALQPESNYSTEELKVFLNLKNIKAEAILNDEGIIVLSGSEVSPSIADSLKDAYKKLRIQLQDSGIIQPKNTKLIFAKDYLFTSPSQAAGIIVGYSINGRQCWKTKEGVSLKEFEENLAQK